MKTEVYPNPAMITKADLAVQENNPAQEAEIGEKTKTNLSQESASETPVAKNKEEIPHSFEQSKDDEELNPNMELTLVDESMTKNKAEIARLTKVVSKDRERLAQLYEKLGVPPVETDNVNGTRLLSLLEEENKLEEQKEKAEAVDGLNEVLEMLSKLPPNELKIIIETGKDSAGNEIKGKNGKVNPDVAKQLGLLAEKGVKKITKVILNIVIGVVKGLAKAIFEVKESGEAQ